MGQGGHLLNQRYINVMSSEDSAFLSQVVDVNGEEATAIRGGEARVMELSCRSHREGETELIQMDALGVAPRAVVAGDAEPVAERRRGQTVDAVP